MTDSYWTRLAAALRLTGRKQESNRPDAPPQNVTVGYDRLRILIKDYASALEESSLWLTYLAIALSMAAAIATGNFDFEGRKLGFSGSQWQVVFTIVGLYSAARAIWLFRKRLTRRTLDDLLKAILHNSEYSHEDRAVFLVKFRDPQAGYRILVYEDPLWECFLLPHANIEGMQPRPVDDENLSSVLVSFLGAQQSSVGLRYMDGCDLRSRKLSEFYRQDTAYRFRFYLVQFREDAAIPKQLKDLKFSFSGRAYSWLTVSEMEAHENTRRRNLDMTRHLSDNEYRILTQTPDSLVAETITKGHS